MNVWSYMGRVSGLFGLALRRPACNKCLAAVDMFVYISTREKGEHHPLLPHVEQSNRQRHVHVFGLIKRSIIRVG